jgi:ribosomal protein S18 acetylase RimI-like enzyme
MGRIVCRRRRWRSVSLIRSISEIRHLPSVSRYPAPDLVRLRPAEPRDVDAIAATLREAFAEFEPLYTVAGFLATTPAPDQLRNRWGEGPAWVVEQDGTVVATVASVPRPGELYVRSMAVRPSARGRGIATRLLETVEAAALAQRYRRLVLSSTPFLHAALQLYERHGFRRTGEADLFGTPLIVMTKELSPP